MNMGRARYLKNREALDRAAREGDLDALAAMAAALDPDRFDGVVDVFHHAELPEGSLRYRIRETGHDYVIPTSFVLAEALEIYRRTNRRPSVFDRHPEALMGS